MKKTKLIPILSTLCLTLTLCLLITISTYAADYSRKRARCPKCNTLNYSYGYDEIISIRTQNVTSGHTCPACQKLVSENEEHTYETTKDRYYFLCNSSECKNSYSTPDRTYHYDYSNGISNHYITKLSK